MSAFVDGIFIFTLAPSNFLSSGFSVCSRAPLHIIPQVSQVKTVEDFSATAFLLLSVLFFSFLRMDTIQGLDIFRTNFLDVSF